MELNAHNLGFDIPSAVEVLRLLIQLTLAVIVGGVLGYEREMAGKAAGVRTHILVCLGSALFVIAVKQSDVGPDSAGRVIQGIAAGVGFIGGGAILKISDQETILGLTTASSIWLTAALGVTIALDNLWVPIIGVIFGVLVLSALNRWNASSKKIIEPG